MKQFRVYGHTLVAEGAPHHANGDRVTMMDRIHDPDVVNTSKRGKCTCGATSLNLDSKAARKRWHYDHKVALIAVGAPSKKAN